MATSGTSTFNPALAEISLYAFRMAQVPATALTVEHFQNLRMAANMMLASWSNKGVNLWTVELEELTLVEGQATYTLDADTVNMLDVYVRQTNLDDTLTDRLIMPISRSEYASYPNKALVNRPTVFWFNRQRTPEITVWPVPNSDAMTLHYYRMRQIEDAAMTSGTNVEIPYRWLEAFAMGLAYRMTCIYKPELAQGAKALADEAYQTAAGADVEDVPIYISPMMGSYWRS